MRRRLLVAIVGTVAASLLLAGLGTLALSWLGARGYVETELRRQVEAVAESYPTLATTRATDEPSRRLVLAALRRALRLEGVESLTLARTGSLVGTPPEGISLDDLDASRLAEGATISGHDGRLVYAATLVGEGPAGTVLVLTNRSGVQLGGAVPWFLIAATGVLIAAVFVAIRMARALTEPLEQASQASHRIAAGDLSVRLPVPPGASDELTELSNSINVMTAALQRSRGLEQQFLLSVSHDLRTPLTSIQGYAEAIADGTADDPVRAGEVILAEARRLDRLVRDLLELARLDARTFSFHIGPVDIAEVIAGCLDGFAPEARDAAVTLRAQAPTGVMSSAVIVAGDADRLAQVVANLLANSLKFAASEVVVSSVRTGSGRVRVTVDDDGPGIAAVDLPHVFERLYVASRQPVRKESGSGLGLAIVRELVTGMGGSVGADRAPTGGARLWFELPLGDASMGGS
jgi:two-component system sensor histidine kinase BaeS